MHGQKFRGGGPALCNLSRCHAVDKIAARQRRVGNGKFLPTLISTVGKAAAGLTPLHYESTLIGTFDSDGTANVVLYGDSGEVGSTVTQTGEGASYAAGMVVKIDSFEITNSPIGNIAIELQAN